MGHLKKPHKHSGGPKPSKLYADFKKWLSTDWRTQKTTNKGRITTEENVEGVKESDITSASYQTIMRDPNARR